MVNFISKILDTCEVVKMKGEALVKEEIYHIMSKSIGDSPIFNNETEYQRMRGLLSYYQYEDPPVKFSKFSLHIKKENPGKKENLKKGEKLVEIIAYSIMPTHFHLILKQNKEKGISIFIKNILNSYTRYFNIRHNRKGPLWEGRFKRVKLETNEQLLHLTRYIHLEPVIKKLVAKPEDWLFSSYREYLAEVKERLCNFEGFLEINPSYKEFVEDRIAYPRELEKIKNLIIEPLSLPTS